MRGIDLARRRGHRRIELQYRLRRLLLIPERDRQHAAGSQRAHVGLHRLLRIGELLHDGEAAGVGEADRIRKREIDDVEALGGLRQEMAALVANDADLGQDVAGEVADDVVVKRLEHGAVALGDRHVLGAGVQRHLSRDAAAELNDESLRRRLDDIRVDHRQEVEVRRLLVSQVAHDADRTVAVDVEAEIGVDRHRRQGEAGVVGQARRKMQIGARVRLEKAERGSALVDFFRVRKFARVGDALVVVDGQRLQAKHLRRDEMAGERDHAGGDKRNERDPSAGAERPGQTGREPQRQRRGDQIGGREHVHRQ